MFVTMEGQYGNNVRKCTFAKVRKKGKSVHEEDSDLGSRIGG